MIDDTVRNHLFNFAAACSACTAVFLIVVWCFAGAVDPQTQFVSLTDGCHVSVKARDGDARLILFNNARNGSLSSIIGFASDPNGPTVSGFGDTAGVYYHHIRWRSGAVLWTLAISLGYPLVAASALPLVWVLRRRRRRGRGFPVNAPQATA